MGGSEVTPYSLPWQVGIVSRKSDFIWCGGSLISDQHVLTAAHCTEDPKAAKGMDVMVGEHDITDSSDGTRHEVCSHTNHPKYKTHLKGYDLSIIHLIKPVQLGTRAVPVCLPRSSFSGDTLVGKIVRVSGWGHLKPGGSGPSVLHSVDVKVISKEQCLASYMNTYHHTSMIQGIDTMICAGQPSGGMDACQGDSGGKNKIGFLIL